MSGKAGWLHPASPAGSTRSYMVGAFVGAAVLLGVSTVAGWPVFPGRAATNDPAAVVASATPGTCLTWTRPDAANLAAVTCTAAHLFEVTGSADISAKYPAGSPFPTEQAWQQAAQTYCTTSATNYLGKLDPNGKYTVGALKPTSAQWTSGDRSLRCGLQRSTSSGLLPTTGSARGADQSNVYPTGTCLALVKKAAGGPVPCGTQHSYEIVGTVSLQGAFPDGYPPVGQQQTALGKLCQPVVAQYTGNANLSQYQLSVTWDTVSQQSWAAGSYSVNCKVGVSLPDGSGLGPVINSIKGIGSGGGAASTTKPGG